ncbi:uncharacterized protein ASCRUDRAFT_80417 [Ascoidea rubescens DSM 1968]|uniref:Uncharacterized protein n=1 Tax=Ascoidea rubescens DSM 1968 TaxID=1344418 RepID=A0A1D2VKI3_9ASCO|nr:hypothetical protein ASCRUDRAFT_80417 [Ascoidea rubescens DSM 1968]ODV62119.1 hypothetical protein ASCRUDRAFT_80417 [Ascoidea rubescens DSM 1968]
MEPRAESQLSYPLQKSNLIQPTYKSVPLNSFNASYMNKSDFVFNFGEHGVFLTYVGDYINFHERSNLHERNNSAKASLPIYINKNGDVNDSLVIYTGNILKQIGSIKTYLNHPIASFDEYVVSNSASYKSIVRDNHDEGGMTRVIMVRVVVADAMRVINILFLVVIPNCLE